MHVTEFLDQKKKFNKIKRDNVLFFFKSTELIFSDSYTTQTVTNLNKLLPVNLGFCMYFLTRSQHIVQ